MSVNKKIKYRILGLLVIIALIIIILPLFQTADTPATPGSSTVTVKAPPFPQSSDVIPPGKLDEFEDQPLSQPNEQQNELIAVPTTPKPNPLLSEEIKSPEKLPEKLPAKTINTPINKPINKINLVPKNNPPDPNATWAIQLGSFRNKNNAIRLINRLRNNGYQAFMRHIPSTFGESIRVYVGPESKKETAKELVAQLETDFHIKGIIIHYQPLAL